MSDAQREPQIESSATLRVPAPFVRGDLARFLEAVPPGAEIRVTTHQGGTQRDPEPVGYTLYARW